jgi:hypothetical protein
MRISLRETSVLIGDIVNTVLGLLKNYIGNNIYRRTVTRHAVRHSLLAPKYMREVSWRLW